MFQASPKSPQHNAPDLIFIKAMEGIAEEEDDTSEPKVFLIAKKRAFIIRIATHVVNLRDVIITASLMYFSEDKREHREVSFVNTDPLEYKTCCNASGTEIAIEVRINALSSQHQGSLFFVNIQIQHATGTYVLHSPPLHAVSKTDSSASGQIKRKRPITEVIQEALQRMETIECTVRTFL